MNYRSSSTHRDSWVHTVLGDQNFQAQKGFFAWWYRHTCPPDPSPGASFQQRDRVRRGRIASACMLFLATILVLVAVIAYAGPNRQIATIIYTLYPMIALCIFLNRRGLVNLVGVLLTLGLVGGMCLTLVTTALRGGLSPHDKDILYLLFFAELFVAAILPIHWVFVVAALNVLLSLFMLTVAPHTPALDALLTTGYASILFRLMQIHVVVPAILWILVSHHRAAIKRADRAEEIARLQRHVAQMAGEQAREKAALDHSIAVISQIHARVANGELDARVPLSAAAGAGGEGETGEPFVLWQIAGQLNTLLNRYQHLREDMRRRERLDQVFQYLMTQEPGLREAVSCELRRQQAAREHASPSPQIPEPFSSSEVR